MTDETAAHRILVEVRPDILVLNAGTPPPMARLDQISWADFTQHDAKLLLTTLTALLVLRLALPACRLATRHPPS